MTLWFRLGLLGALFLWARSSHGQEPVPLPEVLVPAPPDEPPPSSPARKDPSGVSSRVEARTHRGEAKDTAELLASTPSVVVQDRGGAGQSKTLSIRGASPNGVLVLLDGIPLTHSGTNVDLSRLPAAIVERLEVLRGGAGARYGSGGLGGAVNVQTRSLGEGRLFAEFSGGSFASAAGNMGLSTPVLGGEGLVLLHGTRTQGDFTYLFDDKPALAGNPLEARVRTNNHSTAGGLLLKYRRPLGEWTLDAMAEGSVDQRGLAGTIQNPTADASQQAQRLSGTARVGRTFSGGEMTSLLWGRRDALRLGGGLFGPPSWQTDVGVGAELNASWLVGQRHGLSATLQGAFESLVDPSAQGPRWGRVGAMVSDEWWWLDGALALIPSLRVDQSGPFTTFSPKLGVLWQLPWELEFRANAGQAHRAPSFLELYVKQGHLLPNENLRPERALYADAAVARRMDQGLLSVGAFYSLYEDLISYEYYPPMLARPYNFATAQVYGLEVEGQWQPRTWLSASGSYTLLASQNLRDDPRYYLKELPYRPRHKLHGRIVAGPRWFSGRAEVLFQSEQFQNRTQSLSLPARALVNVGASSTFLRAPQLTASLEVKNVLDVQTADLDGYPLPPRAAYLTVSMSYELAPNSTKESP